MEILLTLIYAGLIGFYNVFKKIAVRKSSESVILVLYTSVAFLLSLIWIPFGVGVPPRFIWIFALKGFLLATSWYMTLKVVKTADLSIVIVTNILSAVLSFVLGIVILGEHAGIWQIVGSAVIILGVAGINLVGKKNEGRVTPLNFILLTICALITTASHIIDKYTTTYLNPQQTQFNFLFFVMLFSWVSITTIIP